MAALLLATAGVQAQEQETTTYGPQAGSFGVELNFNPFSGGDVFTTQGIKMRGFLNENMAIRGTLELGLDGDKNGIYNGAELHSTQKTSLFVFGLTPGFEYHFAHFKRGSVYAFERNPLALELLEKNKALFGADNLTIVPGEASANLEAMPVPDCVFIGGSGGNLCKMLDTIYSKNAACRVVINAITVETLIEVAEYYKQHEAYALDIVNVFAARAKKLGAYNLMMAQNPVYVMTALKKGE